MNMLSKPEINRMKSANRITQEELAFCIAQQSAYEAAKTGLSELSFCWENIIKNQKELLGDADRSEGTRYLLNTGKLKISSEVLRNNRYSLHTEFIKQLVYYFHYTYHISLDYLEIVQKLIPQKPKYEYLGDVPDEVYKAKLDEYNKSMDDLSLHYDMILDEIFSQTNGRNLTEQAIYEIKTRCHRAAWNNYGHRPLYELHKNIIRLQQYTCEYHCSYASCSWNLTRDMENILHGIAHFETGSCSSVPNDILKLLTSSPSTDLILLPGCTKVEQIRLFKNGRADIRFASEEFATQFTEEYLGTVYS